MPWRRVNIDLGSTPHPEVEQAVLDEVGCYGSQLGHIGDVMEILLEHVDLDKLNEKQKDKIAILRGELAHVRQVKTRVLTSAAA